ncbi:MAG: hypothetical protein RR791_06120, partial [Lachnospiraceae bacterium]
YARQKNSVFVRHHQTPYVLFISLYGYAQYSAIQRKLCLFGVFVYVCESLLLAYFFRRAAKKAAASSSIRFSFCICAFSLRNALTSRSSSFTRSAKFNEALGSGGVGDIGRSPFLARLIHVYNVSAGIFSCCAAALAPSSFASFTASERYAAV